MPKTYTVKVSFEDNLWIAVVEELTGGATDVEQLEDLQYTVSNLIYTLTGEDPSTFDVVWRCEQENPPEELERFVLSENTAQKR